MLNPGNFSGISFSSKNIKQNDIFAAVRGAASDGINFAEEAIANGAKAIICSRTSCISENLKRLLKQNKITLIKVKNPEAEAAKIARQFFPKQPEFVFAITGTNGKTTIANLTEQLLNLTGRKETATLGTMGFQTSNKKFKKLEEKVNEIVGINPLTTPDTITLHKILDMSYHAGVKYMVIEASSDGIVRNRINEIDFTACGLSNISEDHLITHGSMKNYIDAKFSLFTHLPPKKTAVFNNDNVYTQKLPMFFEKKISGKNIKLIRYGKDYKDNEIFIKDVKPNKNGYDVKFNIFKKEYSARINLVGEFQIYGVMNALGFALAVIPKKEIASAVEKLNKLKTVNGRMELAGRTKKGADVFVDYAHNPASLEIALQDLRKITKGKIISVTGISSGKSESRNETAGIAGKFADVVIFTYISPRSETADEIIAKQQAIFPAGLHGGKTRFDAIKKAIEMAEGGDSILINGQGHERFIVEWGMPVPFYDFDAVKEIISASEDNI